MTGVAIRTNDVEFLGVDAVDQHTDRRDVAAIGPMLRALGRLDWASDMHERIVARLPDFGSALIEPAVAALATDDLELRDLYCSLLARLNARDERIFDALNEAWERDNLIGAQLFVDYGDARALPLIERALLVFAGDIADTLDVLKHGALLSAFRTLGGVLGEDAAAAVVRWIVPPPASSAAVSRRGAPEVLIDEPLRSRSA
jgi:hypothetical protein